MLTHGWPSSFLELIALARRLAAPSDGFARYAAHGGDLGAGVTSLLAQAHPEAVVGIHLLAVADPIEVDPATVTPDEQDYLDAVATWYSEDAAYEHQQMTRPATLSYGLSDSPVGLLAWILEKYRAWSDCGGELSSRFSDDFVLTQASLYWFTNTISTSCRPYYEHAHDMRERLTAVTVPTALAVFPKDISRPPRSWAAHVQRQQVHTHAARRAFRGARRARTARRRPHRVLQNPAVSAQTPRGRRP